MSSNKNLGGGNVEDIHQALGHSLRIEILLELLEHGPTSPSRFVRKRSSGSRLGGKKAPDPKKALSRASYHFRVLEQKRLVVLKERIPIRGAMENVYQITPDRPTLESVLGSANGSRSEMRDSRVKIMHLRVDNRGFEEIKDGAYEFRARIEQAGEASRERMSSAGGQSFQDLQIIYTDLDPESK
jgi:hypothetical protein